MIDKQPTIFSLESLPEVCILRLFRFISALDILRFSQTCALFRLKYHKYAYESIIVYKPQGSATASRTKRLEQEKSNDMQQRLLLIPSIEGQQVQSPEMVMSPSFLDQTKPPDPALILHHAPSYLVIHEAIIQYHHLYTSWFHPEYVKKILFFPGSAEPPSWNSFSNVIPLMPSFNYLGDVVVDFTHAVDRHQVRKNKRVAMASFSSMLFYKFLASASRLKLSLVNCSDFDFSMLTNLPIYQYTHNLNYTSERIEVLEKHIPNMEGLSVFKFDPIGNDKTRIGISRYQYETLFKLLSKHCPNLGTISTTHTFTPEKTFSALRLIPDSVYTCEAIFKGGWVNDCLITNIDDKLGFHKITQLVMDFKDFPIRDSDWNRLQEFDLTNLLHCDISSTDSLKVLDSITVQTQCNIRSTICSSIKGDEEEFLAKLPPKKPKLPLCCAFDYIRKGFEESRERCDFTCIWHLDTLRLHYYCQRPWLVPTNKYFSNTTILSRFGETLTSVVLSVSNFSYKRKLHFDASRFDANKIAWFRVEEMIPLIAELESSDNFTTFIKLSYKIQEDKRMNPEYPKAKQYQFTNYIKKYTRPYTSKIVPTYREKMDGTQGSREQQQQQRPVRNYATARLGSISEESGSENGVPLIDINDYMLHTLHLLIDPDERVFDHIIQPAQGLEHYLYSCQVNEYLLREVCSLRFLKHLGMHGFFDIFNSPRFNLLVNSHSNLKTVGYTDLIYQTNNNIQEIQEKNRLEKMATLTTTSPSARNYRSRMAQYETRFDPFIKTIPNESQYGINNNTPCTTSVTTSNNTTTTTNTTNETTGMKLLDVKAYQNQNHLFINDKQLSTLDIQTESYSPNQVNNFTIKDPEFSKHFYRGYQHNTLLPKYYTVNK